MYKRFALNSHTHWIEFEGNSLADKKLEKISATQRLSWIVCGFVSIFLSLYGWHKNGHKCHFESQCFNPVILFIDCDYENLWELCILPMWDFIAFNCIAYKSCDTHYKLVKKNPLLSVPFSLSLVCHLHVVSTPISSSLLCCIFYLLRFQMRTYLWYTKSSYRSDKNYDYYIFYFFLCSVRFSSGLLRSLRMTRFFSPILLA